MVSRSTKSFYQLLQSVKSNTQKINSITTSSLNRYVEKTLIKNSQAGLASSGAQSQVIPPPNLEGQAKQYSAKIENLVDEISKLNLIEVSDLNELLRKN